MRNLLTWLYRSPSKAAIALRTVVQTFVGALVAAWIADGNGRVSSIGDVVSAQADLAAGSALLAGLLALVWHASKRTPPTP